MERQSNLNSVENCALVARRFFVTWHLKIEKSRMYSCVNELQVPGKGPCY